MKIAKRTDWKTILLPSKRTKINIDRIFSKAESTLIMAGFIPKEMEDKWFIYYENETLYFHRSWTGNCIFVVHFVLDEGPMRATHIEANRDPVQYNNASDGKDLRLVNRLIDTLLLRKNINCCNSKD
jgi:hypothetical protein